MPDPEEILSTIESLLDQLIVTADKLKELSLQVISEEEIEPLQKEQGELLRKLVEADRLFTEACREGSGHFKSHKQARIGEKLKHFEKLNSFYIENLQTTHELIDFDATKLNKLKSWAKRAF